MSGSRHVLPRAPWYVSPGRTRPTGSGECRRADEAADDRRKASGGRGGGPLARPLAHSRETPVCGFGEKHALAVMGGGLAIDLGKHRSVFSVMAPDLSRSH